MTAAIINAFCRQYDLIFMEVDREDDKDIYYFIDHTNTDRVFTREEIKSKMEIPV